MSTAEGGANVVINGLVFYLDAANEKSIVSGQTIWNNLTINNYDATLFNDAKYVSTNLGSIRFDGTNDYCSIPYDSGIPYDINLTGEITLDVWLKWDDITRNLDGGIAYGKIFGNNTAGHYQWEFCKLVSGGQFRSFFAISNLTNNMFLNQITNDGFFLPNTTIQNNKWFNFLYTYNFSTGTIKGYVNGTDAGGVIVGTNPSSIQTPSASFRSLSIGADAPASGLYSMLGDIASIKIYNRVLSSSEILQNFNASRSRFGL
jgi:hypothetical protein